MDLPPIYEQYLRHRSVQTDTRKLQTGDLYFALRGPSFNGNDFARQALAQGASCAVVDEPALRGAPDMFFVDDVLECLQQLALHHRRQLRIPFLAITGSNGKTTTKELIAATLATGLRVSATEGNLNNHIGVPLTILRIPEGTELAVIEMGANHRHEIESYCRIALPTHGLITNCGKAHIEGFGGEEGVRKGKGELYDFLREHGGAIFRNADLDYLETMAHGIGGQIVYGSEKGTVIGQPAGSGTLLSVDMNIEGEPLHADTQLVGSYNLPNVLAAAAVGHYFGIGNEQIRQALTGYRPDNSRSQQLRRGPNTIILDAYNANPSSMKAAIENFASLPLPHKRVWIGAMKEMGDAAEAEHRALVALLRRYDWEQVVLVGNEFQGMASGKERWFERSEQAAESVRADPPSGASILIKGSRGSKMEYMLNALPE